MLSVTQFGSTTTFRLSLYDLTLSGSVTRVAKTVSKIASKGGRDELRLELEMSLYWKFSRVPWDSHENGNC